MKQFQSFQQSLKEPWPWIFKHHFVSLRRLRVLHLAKNSHAASKQHQQSYMRHG
ncbi:hypothetical protein ISN44_As07g014530, partial [Arabidopsis suecica]